MNIVIATPNLVYNDAVSNDVMKQYLLLAKAGYVVHIYCQSKNVDEKSFRFISPGNKMDRLVNSKDSLIIYHHSVYWERGEQTLESATCHKLLKYHNITPSHFFENINDDYFSATQLGYKQTKRFLERGIFDSFSADSKYNAGQLMEMGLNKEVSIIPPFTKLEDFDREKIDFPLCRDLLTSNHNNILFVGRFAPNKGHEHLLKIIHSYREYFDDKIHLHVVGGIDERLKLYNELIEKQIIELGLSDYVTLYNQISFNKLVTLYKTCDAFLLCSEHEGFCVPILEAQYCSLPVIVLQGGASGQTLGENQIMFAELEPLKFAIALRQIKNSIPKKMFLITEGHRNLERFSNVNIGEKTINLLSSIMNQNDGF